jgi:hypothetical protein
MEVGLRFHLVLLCGLNVALTACDERVSRGSTVVESACDSVQIISVVRRTFTDGSPPALHVTFKSQLKTADSSGLAHEFRNVWTHVGADVESQGYNAAILTAMTEFRKYGAGAVRVTVVESRGFVVLKDKFGRWRHQGALISFNGGSRCMNHL